MLKENHRARQMRGGGYQQERGVADGLLNGGGFFFRIFWFIQRNNIATRYAQRLRHPRTDFRRAYRIGFATPPVKISFTPGFARHSRMPSASRGKLLLIKLELGAHCGFQV